METIKKILLQNKRDKFIQAFKNVNSLCRVGYMKDKELDKLNKALDKNYRDMIKLIDLIHNK